MRSGPATPGSPDSFLEASIIIAGDGRCLKFIQHIFTFVDDGGLIQFIVDRVGISFHSEERVRIREIIVEHIAPKWRNGVVSGSGRHHAPQLHQPVIPNLVIRRLFPIRESRPEARLDVFQRQVVRGFVIIKGQQLGHARTALYEGIGHES